MLRFKSNVMLEKTVVWLLARGRWAKQIGLIFVDAIIVVVSIWLAYSIRLNGFFVPNSAQMLLMAAGPLIAIPIFNGFGLYRSLIRYVGEDAIWSALKAVGLSALLWGTLAFMIRAYGVAGVPRSVLVLSWLLSLTMVIAVRFLARWFLLSVTIGPSPRRHVLIYGAGEAARQISASLRSDNPRLSIVHIVDDSNLHGRLIGGNVVHSSREIPDLIKRYDIKDAIVTLRGVSNKERIGAVEALRKHGLKVRLLPAFVDIANGKHTINMVRNVEIGDLLGRDAVAPDPELMGAITTGKVVLVTGAGGSIGSVLCHQAAVTSPAKLILLESSEVALYRIIRELEQQTDVEIVPILASVTNGSLVRHLLEQHKVQTIFHAAAYKHVPLVEANPFEGIRNNVFGTLAAVSAAYETGVEDFVLVSTDKAVRPLSIMGASKRVAELIIQDFAAKAKAHKPEKTFCAVRFGNVIGSSGSVIPLFKEQIRNGGPITLTHPEATRYFMSVEEAGQLVIQAGSLSRLRNKDGSGSASIFLLDMGGPILIKDLAENMIQLSNLMICDEANPDGDIAIRIVGLRPGEKLHEELLYSLEQISPTAHPKISVVAETLPEGLNFGSLYAELEAITEAEDLAA